KSASGASWHGPFGHASAELPSSTDSIAAAGGGAIRSTERTGVVTHRCARCGRFIRYTASRLPEPAPRDSFRPASPRTAPHQRGFAPVLVQRALELASVAETRERVAHRPLLRLEDRAGGGKAGSQFRHEAL